MSKLKTLIVAALAPAALALFAGSASAQCAAGACYPKAQVVAAPAVVAQPLVVAAPLFVVPSAPTVQVVQPVVAAAVVAAPVVVQHHAAVVAAPVVVQKVIVQQQRRGLLGRR